MSLPLLNLLDAPNPLLASVEMPPVDPSVIDPAVIKRKIPAKRQIEDMRRLQSAAAAVANLERDGCELYGLTRGQFSLTDMIEAILEKTGPAAMSISTWTAAQTDVSRMLELLNSGKITSCRWLVDLTFIRRCPALVAEIRKQFGQEAIRVTRTHAKFVTITNTNWQVALRSSMNLNQNPRLESFEVGHDPELCSFLVGIIDQVWQRQDRSIADSGVPSMGRWFNENN
jgi:hypothetical protein